MKVIGLCGPARSGKDTVAEMVAETYPGNVVRQGFADKLKLSAARIFEPDITLEDAIAWCNTIKSTGRISAVGEGSTSISGRQFLQHYGTEAHRDVFGEGFWLDAVLPEGRDDCDLLVIPDVRFDNEAQRILDRGGQVWELIRPDAKPVEAHASEARLPEELITDVLPNEGSLDELRARVGWLLDSEVPA